MHEDGDDTESVDLKHVVRLTVPSDLFRVYYTNDSNHHRSSWAAP